MRPASLIDRDLGAKCVVAVVSSKHFGHGERMQGRVAQAHRAHFPPPSHFSPFLTVCPISFDKLFMSSIYGKLKFATVLDRVFLLLTCSNMAY